MSFSKGSLELVPALCPRCSGALAPLPDDVVFHCPACGGVSELTEGRFEPRPSRVLAAPEKGAVHLPLWRLEDGSVVPAFNGTRLLTWSRWYSGRRTQLQSAAEGRTACMVGGRLGSRDAARVASLLVDGRPGSRPKQSREDSGILALPFRAAQGRLECALTGLHLYFETIEGIKAILARAGAGATPPSAA